MSLQVCLVCKKLGVEGKVYCQDCGGVLVLGKEAWGKVSGLTQAKPAEFVVGTRTPNPIVQKKKNLLFSAVHSLMMLLFFLSVAGVLFLLTLILLPLKEKSHPDFQIPGHLQISDPKVPLQGVFTIAQTTQANLAEGLINANLKKFGIVTWKPLNDSIPPLVWLGSWVKIDQNQATYFLDLSFLGWPLHLSEAFSLGGSSRHWLLIPSSGNVGRLPISESFLPLLTRFMQSTSNPFAKELQALSYARSLQLVPGKVVFSLQ